MFKSSALLFVALLNLGVGLVVLQRAPKKISNISFSLLNWSMCGWDLGIAMFLLTEGSRQALFWAKFYYFFPVLIGASLMVYAQTFPNNRKLEARWFFPLILVTILLLAGLVLVDGFIAVGVVSRSWGKEVLLNKSNYLVYSLFILVTFAVSLVRMAWIGLRSKGLDGTQTKFFSSGFFFASLFGVIFNLILPWFGNYRIIWAGPLFTGILAIVISYTIIRHKMFDIRAVLARSIAYLFTLGFGIGVYAVLLFGAGTVFVQLDTITVQQWVVIGLLALLLAVTYAPVVRVFNKQTNKLFFRDIYDVQSVLDQVSGIIVGNVDQHKLQKGALAALSDALKPSYVAFLLNTRGGGLFQGDSIGAKLHIRNHDLLNSTLKRIGKKIVVFDELDEKSSKVKDVLRSEDINIVAPLVTKDETIGYLILGPRKSGKLYSSQDIGLLNIATNELAVALQNAQRFEEIQAFNATLQEKVTEATRELKATNKKLVALDQAKDEFISMASHQLRTPLTSIKGYLSMLVEGDLGKMSASQENALKEAFGSSQRMVYLIADFLNVSRIKTGKFIIEPKEVDLPEIVHEEITQLREMAGSRDLTITYEQPEVFPRVQLDENKIRQVMMNMVDNAIYYTPSGGTITIQLYSNGDEIVFKVLDNGIGVPRQEQHKLFTKFYRAGNAKKARPDGTGLGLFMAQKIVVEQGGAIIFESTEGKGSTFGFRFPLSKIKA
jgi:signal transduction histidine kinase